MLSWLYCSKKSAECDITEIMLQGTINTINPNLDLYEPMADCDNPFDPNYMKHAIKMRTRVANKMLSNERTKFWKKENKYNSSYLNVMLIYQNAHCVFYTHHDITEDQTMLKCSPVSSIPIMIAQKIRQRCLGIKTKPKT